MARRRAGCTSRLGKAVCVQLCKDGVLDACVAGGSRVERTKAPTVAGFIASLSTSTPSRQTLAVEKLICLLSSHAVAEYPILRGCVVYIDWVVEIPQVDAVEVRVLVELVAVVRTWLAEAMTREASIKIDVARLICIIRCNSILVKGVDCRYTIVEGRSQFHAQPRRRS